MPAPILTGWIVQQWVAFIETDQMWLSCVSSLDVSKGLLSHPLCHPGAGSVAAGGLVL